MCTFQMYIIEPQNFIYAYSEINFQRIITFRLIKISIVDKVNVERLILYVS